MLLLFCIKNDVDLLQQGGYLKNYTKGLCLEFKRLLMEQNEEDLDYPKIKGESVIERISNR